MDCFWLNAGYAVYGGYKGGGAARGGLALDGALDAVQVAIEANRIDRMKGMFTHSPVWDL